MNLSSEICPFDPVALQQKLWREHGAVQEQLRKLINPVAELASQEADSTIGDINAIVSRNPEPIIHGLPYSADIASNPYTLPPLLFGVDIHTESFELPSDVANRAVIVDNFLQTRRRLVHDAGIKTIDTIDGAHWLYLLGRTDRLVRAGVRIDPVKWRSYLSGALQQIGAGFYTLELAGEQREKSIATMLADQHKSALVQSNLVGQAQEYAFRTNVLRLQDRESTKSANFLFGCLQLPVGAYGRDFTTSLIKSAEYLLEISTLPSIKALADRSALGSVEIITTHLARGRKDSRNTPSEALVETTQEGIVSISQALSILTAEHVEGYEDPVQLVRDITDAGLIEQFTRSIPVGLNGPFSLAGLYFPGLLEKGPRGLQLNPDILGALREVRKARMTELLGYWALYYQKRETGEDSIPPELGLFCPAAGNNEGISKLAKSLTLAMETQSRGQRQLS